MLDSSKNVMNVSKYTFPGILALTHCLWQWKHATSTGHISFPLVKLGIIQASFKENLSFRPRLTDLWLLFVQCNLLCGPWVCTWSAPTVQPRSPTMPGPQSLDVCFARKSLRTSSGFSHWCSVFSDVSRKARTYSRPRSPKQLLQLPPSNRKQSQSWRLRRRLRSLPFIAPWPLLAPTLQVRHIRHNFMMSLAHR